jgi:glyoxylase-like metal-dependent hydrolase (beta-lactamase superfamily II)
MSVTRPHDMIIERAVHPQWHSNTFLVAAAPGGPALFVDAGAGVDRLLSRADELALEVTHVLVTHRHEDHVEEAHLVRERFPDAHVLCHREERADVPAATGDVGPGERLAIGALTVEVLETPGHTRGAICPLVDGHLFTGDTLFRRSVGGIVSPGHTTFEDLRRSIMDVVLEAPADTVILPGHGELTSVAEELEHNPFVRVWRGLEPEGAEQCVADGEPARLIVWATDYDGGHKAWVRRGDGCDEILAGSRVERRIPA